MTRTILQLLDKYDCQKKLNEQFEVRRNFIPTNFLKEGWNAVVPCCFIVFLGLSISL